MSYETAAIESRMWRRNQNTVRHQISAASLGPVAQMVIIAMLLAVLGMIYLTQITKTSTYGYQLQSLETQKSQLTEQNQLLQSEAARLQSMGQIQKGSSNLVTPNQVSYAQ
ncbi:MAG TPA: hypothetical protein VGS28_04545 [Candidatus Saccharimonadales bacterium]|nr:hypothetical protein [Candidatus Saccharimonadales bacterium]